MPASVSYAQDFINKQKEYISTPLTVPPELPDDVDAKSMAAVVAQLNADLKKARAQLFHPTRVAAVIEQLRMLADEQDGKQKSAERTGVVDLVIEQPDGDDTAWLEELPEEWNVPGGEHDDYAERLRSVKELANRKKELEEKAAHYEKLLAMLEAVQ